MVLTKYLEVTITKETQWSSFCYENLGIWASFKNSGSYVLLKALDYDGNCSTQPFKYTNYFLLTKIIFSEA